MNLITTYLFLQEKKKSSMRTPRQRQQLPAANAELPDDDPKMSLGVHPILFTSQILLKLTVVMTKIVMMEIVMMTIVMPSQECPPLPLQLRGIFHAQYQATDPPLILRRGTCHRRSQAIGLLLILHCGIIKSRLLQLQLRGQGLENHSYQFLLPSHGAPTPTRY